MKLYQQIKFVGILAAIQFRIFCLSVSNPRAQGLKYTKQKQLYTVLFKGMELDLSH
jgi:hypothetical protein